MAKPLGPTTPLFLSARLRAPHPTPPPFSLCASGPTPAPPPPTPPDLTPQPYPPPANLLLALQALLPVPSHPPAPSCRRTPPTPPPPSRNLLTGAYLPSSPVSPSPSLSSSTGRTMAEAGGLGYPLPSVSLSAPTPLHPGRIRQWRHRPVAGASRGGFRRLRAEKEMVADVVWIRASPPQLPCPLHVGRIRPRRRSPMAETPDPEAEATPTAGASGGHEQRRRCLSLSNISLPLCQVVAGLRWIRARSTLAG
jgi:hypothetical protein